MGFQKLIIIKDEVWIWNRKKKEISKKIIQEIDIRRTSE
jgi:hypothetical protein